MVRMWPEAGLVWIAFFWQDQSSGRRFCRHARWLRAGFFEREARVDPFASGRLAAIVPSAQGHALVGGGGDAVAPRRRLKSAAEASEHERRGVPDSGRGAEGFGRAATSERAEGAKTFSPGRAASSTPFGPTGNSSVAEAARSACFNTPRHEFRFQGTTHRHQARTAANHDASSDRYPCLDHTPHLLRSSGFQFQISGFRARAPPSVQLASRRPVWRAGGLEGWRPEVGDGRPETGGRRWSALPSPTRWLGAAAQPIRSSVLGARRSTFDPLRTEVSDPSYIGRKDAGFIRSCSANYECFCHGKGVSSLATKSPTRALPAGGSFCVLDNPFPRKRTVTNHNHHRNRSQGGPLADLCSR
jgi:hypothetical protein